MKIPSNPESMVTKSIIVLKEELLKMFAGK